MGWGGGGGYSCGVDSSEEPLRNPKHSSAPFRTPLRNALVAASLSDISSFFSSLCLSVYVSQTANSMLWAIFNLSRNPGAQKKLLEEIRAVVAPDEDPCGEHIKSMPYLKACLKESMRYSEPYRVGFAVLARRLLLRVVHCDKTFSRL